MHRALVLASGLHVSQVPVYTGGDCKGGTCKSFEVGQFCFPHLVDDEGEAKEMTQDCTGRIKTQIFS